MGHCTVTGTKECQPPRSSKKLYADGANSSGGYILGDRRKFRKPNRDLALLSADTGYDGSCERSSSSRQNLRLVKEGYENQMATNVVAVLCPTNWQLKREQALADKQKLPIGGIQVETNVDWKEERIPELLPRATGLS